MIISDTGEIRVEYLFRLGPRRLFVNGTIVDLFLSQVGDSFYGSAECIGGAENALLTKQDVDIVLLCEVKFVLGSIGERHLVVS